MPIDISKEEFCKLPSKHMLGVLFENTQEIRKHLESIDGRQSDHENSNKLITFLGASWLFILTVYVGLRKYLPIF